MKTLKIAKWLGVFASAFILMGCPYSSSVPLSEPVMKISDNLIGTWELSGNTDGDKVTVRRTGANTVDIVKTSGYDESETTYSGHLTDISGTLFLNVKEEGEYGTYYFYKIEKDGEFKIRLLPVTTYIRETFEDSGEMKRFFEANMSNSYFFTTDEELYYKIK